MFKGDETALIAAAAAGLGLADIAVAADVSISTVQRRLRDPEILSAIGDFRAQEQREIAGQLSAGQQEALERLHRLTACYDESVALRAIKEWFALAVRYSKAEQLEARLRRLEERFEGDAL